MPESLENFIEKKKSECVKNDLNELLKNKKQDRDISNILLDNKIINHEGIFRIYDTYTRYKNLMKENRIIFNEYFRQPIKHYNSKVKNNDELITHQEKMVNITLFEKAIEKLEDDIQNSIINNEAKKLFKSVISKKYKNLTDETTFNIFRELYSENINRNEIQSFVTQKIAQYKTPKEFNEALSDYLNQKIGWSHEAFLETIKKEVPEECIHYTDNNLIVFEAHDFETSKKMGSSMWCVSREEEYYQDYTYEIDRLIFVYDFNKKPDNIESLTAYIAEPDGLISSGYYKDDDSIPVDEYANIEKLIKPITKNRVKEKITENINQKDSDTELDDLYGRAINNDFTDILIEIIGEEKVENHLNDKYSIRFDGGRMAGAGATNSFEFLNNFYLSCKDDMQRNEWLTRGYLFIEKAVEGGHLKLAERIFNDENFKNVMHDIKDDLKIKTLPNTLLKDGFNIRSSEDKKKIEEFTMKIIDDLELDVKDIFSPQNTRKTVFDFYQNNFPDFIENLKDSPDQGYLYINSLLYHEYESRFDTQIKILKELGLSKEQKEKCFELVEKNFNKTLKMIPHNRPIQNILEQYNDVFEHFGNPNFKSCLEKLTIEDLLSREKYEAFSVLLKENMLNHVDIPSSIIDFIHDVKNITFQKKVETHLDNIIDELEKRKAPQSKRIKP